MMDPLEKMVNKPLHLLRLITFYLDKVSRQICIDYHLDSPERAIANLCEFFDLMRIAKH